MNILVFSWRDPKNPLAGGAEQVMHEHMKGWVVAGHTVTLFTSRFIGSSKQEDIDGVNVVRGGNQNYLGVQLSGFFYYQNHKDIYDFIVDQFHGFPFFTPLYVKQPKLAVIQETAREVWFLNPLPWPLNWIIGIIGYVAEPFIFLLYRRNIFMTGSRSAKQDVTSLGIPEKNIYVVPHGVIVKNPDPWPKKELVHTISYLGILSRDKGIEDALSCFKILDTQGNYNFWVIGRGETKRYEYKLQDVVKKMNLKNKITFWGHVSQDKKFELLARSHILINPSIREGWGLVNIEANSMEAPVVAYKSQGLVDSVKENFSGVFSKSNTPEGLAKSIVYIFQDKKLYQKLSKGAKIWASQFAWEKSTKLSLNLLKKLQNN